MDYVELGGEMRPIAFAMRMAYIYEQENHSSFQADLLGLSLSQAALELESGNGLITPNSTNVMTLANIVHAALLAGHRRDKAPVDFDVFDVVGWLDENPESVALIVQGIYNVLPREKEKPGKKKMGPQQAKTPPRR